MPNLTDSQIARMARARVSFRFHATLYLLVNVFMFGIGFMTARPGCYWPA